MFKIKENDKSNRFSLSLSPLLRKVDEKTMIASLFSDNSLFSNDFFSSTCAQEEKPLSEENREKFDSIVCQYPQNQLQKTAFFIIKMMELILEYTANSIRIIGQYYRYSFFPFPFRIEDLCIPMQTFLERKLFADFPFENKPSPLLDFSFDISQKKCIDTFISETINFITYFIPESHVNFVNLHSFASDEIFFYTKIYLEQTIQFQKINYPIFFVQKNRRKPNIIGLVKTANRCMCQIKKCKKCK